MANIALFIELQGGRPADSSLRLVKAGRYLADELGAAVYGLLPMSTQAQPGAELGASAEEHAVAALSRAGVDKVVLLSGPPGATPTVSVTCGTAVVDALRTIEPRVVLFAASEGNSDMAAFVASSLSAPYAVEPPLHPSLFADLPALSVVTLATHGLPPLRGDDDAEVVVMPHTRDPFVERVIPVGGRQDAQLAHLDADIIVSAGAAVRTAHDQKLLRTLADRLGAPLLWTAEACRQGLAPPALAIGLDAGRIGPRLYVACGSSGSVDHLRSVSKATTVVAINRDAKAPIVRSAHYGLVGDLRVVVPQLIESLT